MCLYSHDNLEMSLMLEINFEVLDNYFHKLSHIDLFYNFLIRGGFQRERNGITKGFLLIFLEIITYNYTRYL